MRHVVIQTGEDFPIKDEQRRCTDIAWLGVPVLFFMFFIYCLLVFNSEYARMLASPTDGRGIVCGIGAPEFPFLYVVNPMDIRNRICVAICPSKLTKVKTVQYNLNLGTRWSMSRAAETQREHPILANMNPKNIIPTVALDTIRGDFCLPIDLTIRAKLIVDSGLKHWAGFLVNLKLVSILVGVSVLLCGGYIALLLYFPVNMNLGLPVAGGLMISTFGVNLLFYGSKTLLSNFNKIMLGLFLFTVGSLILLSTWFYRKQLKVHGVYVEHASKLIRGSGNIHLYVLIFTTLSFLLVALSFYQFLAVWTTLKPTFVNIELYYQANSRFSRFFSFLIALQLWWGLGFLKEFFNYSVSSVSADWYFNKRVKKGLFSPMFRALRFHCGSLIYGSLLVSTLGILNFLNNLTSPRQFNIRLDRTMSNIWKPCSKVLANVRPDAFAYIDLSGLPYTPSAVHCNQLCRQLNLYRDIQTANRVFRIGSYGLFLGFMGYIAIYHNYNMSLSALLLMFAFIMMISMYFVGLYADVAEALNIIFLSDEYRTDGFSQDASANQPFEDTLNVHRRVRQQPLEDGNLVTISQPVFDPINEQLGKKLKAAATMIGEEEPILYPANPRYMAQQPSTLSQHVQNQLGYRFRGMGYPKRA